jgi:hypothetical protein
MQEKALGAPIAPSTSLRRGDLMFWNGHVGILRDAAMLLHASAHHMAVIVEPVAEATARIRGTSSDITSIRRLEIGRTSAAR